MDDEEMGLDYEDRITKQRIARRDLTLTDQPIIDFIGRWCPRILVFHVGFCFLIMLLCYTSPDLARALARMVSPLAAAIFWINPTYPTEHQFTGTLGTTFYTSMIGEALFMSVMGAVACAVIYLGRYWRRPWRFGEFFAEQLGIQKSYASTIFFGLMSLLFSGLFALALYIWLGFAGPETMGGVLKPHQLVLWCLMLLGAAVGFSYTAMLSISTLLFLLHRIATGNA